MKTSVFGMVCMIMTVVTLSFVFNICRIGDSTGTDLSNDLKSAMTISLETACDGYYSNSYSITNNNELTADMIEGISSQMSLPEGAYVDITVKQLDMAKGILSVHADEHIPMSYGGKEKVVSADKTIILDSRVNGKKMCYEDFYINGDLYKHYSLPEGGDIYQKAPNDPIVEGKTFKGWTQIIMDGDKRYGGIDYPVKQSDIINYSTRGESASKYGYTYNYYAVFN